MPRVSRDSPHYIGRQERDMWRLQKLLLESDANPNTHVVFSCGYRHHFYDALAPGTSATRTAATTSESFCGNPNAQQGYHGPTSAAFRLTRRDNLKVVQQLLDLGANVHGRGTMEDGHHSKQCRIVSWETSTEGSTARQEIRTPSLAPADAQ